MPGIEKEREHVGQKRNKLKTTNATLTKKERDGLVKISECDGRHTEGEQIRILEKLREKICKQGDMQDGPLPRVLLFHNSSE